MTKKEMLTYARYSACKWIRADKIEIVDALENKVSTMRLDPRFTEWCDAKCRQIIVQNDWMPWEYRMNRRPRAVDIVDEYIDLCNGAQGAPVSAFIV